VQGRERAVPPQVEILLVSGLHANETRAPLKAREVFKTTSTDVDASRRRGYLDHCLASKVADWIMTRTRL
jgi:hypothetical protein